MPFVQYICHWYGLIINTSCNNRICRALAAPKGPDQIKRTRETTTSSQRCPVLGSKVTRRGWCQVQNSQVWFFFTTFRNKRSWHKFFKISNWETNNEISKVANVPFIKQTNTTSFAFYTVRYHVLNLFPLCKGMPLCQQIVCCWYAVYYTKSCAEKEKHHIYDIYYRTKI